MPNSHVAIYNDYRGPNNSLTVREASMSLAVAEAADIINRGWADVMVVGATGTRIHPLRTMHAVLNDKLATNCPDPTTMSRPFDASSDAWCSAKALAQLCSSRLRTRHRAEPKLGDTARCWQFDGGTSGGQRLFADGRLGCFR